MDMLSNWDDLLHGTVVFAALVPFLVAAVLSWFWPERIWLAVVCGVGVSLAWLFGLPKIPPGSSDDAMVSALLAGVVTLWLGRIEKLGWWRWLIGLGIWCGLAWSLYPAWLAAEGGVVKRALVCGAMGVSVAGAGALARWGTGRESERRVSPWVVVLPTVVLAGLLQMGGSTQFTQTAGALVAAVVGVLVVAWRKGGVRFSDSGVLWGTMFAMLAWSGWLFAEVSVVAVGVVAGAAGLGLVRGGRAVAAGSIILALAAAWIGWQAYGGGSEGY